jgi:hypothetical protein
MLRVFLLLVGIFASVAKAQDKVPSYSLSEVNFFAKNTMSIGLVRNYPVRQTAEQFIPGQIHPLLGYKYFFQNWELGIFTQFKMLQDDDSDDKFSIWTVGEEILYGVKLYHPVYVYFGSKVLFLSPTESGKFPIKRNLDYEVEVGVAASVELYYFIDKKRAVSFHADRWRGTKTLLLEGVELGITLSVALQ